MQECDFRYSHNRKCESENYRTLCQLLIITMFLTHVWSSCEDSNRIIIDRFDEVILNFFDGYISISNSQKSGYRKKHTM